MADMLIAPIQAIGETSISGAAAGIKQAEFSDWLVNQVAHSETAIKAAESEVQKLALGEADNLHQVMISLSKAKTSFELTLQVRNKLLEGFQEVMRMSV
ncbi:MAG: flagellar hook-basal body complex protein FliE [Pseudomonadota bacterium]|jgi:flagellar hook-basal body complex protein FliE